VQKKVLSEKFQRVCNVAEWVVRDARKFDGVWLMLLLH